MRTMKSADHTASSEQLDHYHLHSCSFHLTIIKNTVEIVLAAHLFQTELKHIKYFKHLP